MADRSVSEADRPRTRSEEKRAQVLDAASRLFTAAGYGAVSMDAIAAEAKVSKRTVYSHFEDKSALFSAIMERHCDAIGGRLILIEDSDGRIVVDNEVRAGFDDDRPRTVLVHFLDRFLRILLSTNAVRVFRILMAEAERFPELAESFVESGPRPMVRRLSCYLAQIAQDAGVTLDDPEKAAWRLIVLTKEPFHFQLGLGIAPPPSADTLRAHIEDTVDFFLQAYGLDAR